MSEKRDFKTNLEIQDFGPKLTAGFTPEEVGVMLLQRMCEVGCRCEEQEIMDKITPTDLVGEWGPLTDEELGAVKKYYTHILDYLTYINLNENITLKNLEEYPQSKMQVLLLAFFAAKLQPHQIIYAFFRGRDNPGIFDIIQKMIEYAPVFKENFPQETERFTRFLLMQNIKDVNFIKSVKRLDYEHSINELLSQTREVYLGREILALYKTNEESLYEVELCRNDLKRMLLLGDRLPKIDILRYFEKYITSRSIEERHFEIQNMVNFVEANDELMATREADDGQKIQRGQLFTILIQNLHQALKGQDLTGDRRVYCNKLCKLLQIPPVAESDTTNIEVIKYFSRHTLEIYKKEIENGRILLDKEQ